MANEIPISVVDRKIKVGRHVPATMTNIGKDYISISLDNEWSSTNHRLRVTLYSEAPYVSVQNWWDGKSAIEIPQEITSCPTFKVTVALLSEDGHERLVTQAMDEPIENPRNGHDEGAEPGVRTMDIIARIDNLAADLEEKRDTDYWRGEPGKDGAPGAPGEPGADGYSPTANVTKVGGTATITITDKNGTTTATVSDGAPGKDGSDATATDVRIAGNSITTDGVANIPVANGTTIGVVMTDNQYGGYGTGLFMTTDNHLFVNTADAAAMRNRMLRRIIDAKNIDYAVRCAICDGKGEAWTDAEKLAARERLGIGGSIDITTLTFEEPVNNATLTFQTPKPYSTVIVQFHIPETPGDANNRACPMQLYVSKQDGSDEKSMYTWINIPNIANNRLNFVGLLSNNNGLWNWQVKGPIDNDYYANSAWIMQLPSYKNPADFIVKERPYVKKIDIGWVSSAFPAGSSITAYGVL